METEFKNVPFDIIRYSMVWEGADTLLNGLRPGPGDHLLVITSGGCNVLNMLLSDCDSVTAVDLNPLQNKLLHLKGHVIAHHPYQVYNAILGFEGSEAVWPAAQNVLSTLPEDEKAFWDEWFRQHSQGLLLAGKLEKYITSFHNQLNPAQQQLMHRLFSCETIGQQADCFNELIHSGFKEPFVEYFNRSQLSRGRDPRLFKYTVDQGGESFFLRLQRFLKKHLLAKSFISRFFFYGPAGMSQQLRPACYQERNYEALKQSWKKLTVHTGEAIDFLCSPAGEKITKASLSNIFEYTSPEIFEATVGELLQQRKCQLRFIYWNLLNEQGGKLKNLPAYQKHLSSVLSEQEDCFYFDSVNLFQTAND